MKKTIAQQLNIKEFPFKIKNSKGKLIYFENSYGDWTKQEFDSEGKEVYIEDSCGYWSKREYDSNGKETYYENSNGYIEDNRTKPSCEGKIVEIDGIEYELKAIN